MLYALVLVRVKFFRFLAKILIPEGSKDVPVGQPIAITVSYDNPLSMVSFCFHGKPSTVDFNVGDIFHFVKILENILGKL
jgi:hypothetical protein